MYVYRGSTPFLDLVPPIFFSNLYQLLKYRAIFIHTHDTLLQHDNCFENVEEFKLIHIGEITFVEEETNVPDVYASAGPRCSVTIFEEGFHAYTSYTAYTARRIAAAWQLSPRPRGRQGTARRGEPRWFMRHGGAQGSGDLLSRIPSSHTTRSRWHRGRLI